MSDTGGRVLLCVHGRGRKPGAEELSALWRSALQMGLLRDHKKAAAQLEEVELRHLYFGDLTAALLDEVRPRVYDQELDLADLHAALAALGKLDKARRFRRQYYEDLPGKSALKEFAADIGSGVGGRLGLGAAFWRRAAPEVAAMLSPGDYREALVARIANALAPLLAERREVLVLAHCVGSVATYRALCQLSSIASRGPEPAGSTAVALPPGKLHTLVTMGSPLADDVVRKSLPTDLAPDRQHPDNILNWFNVAAEDDYLCHDETMANDFAPMLNQRLLSRLEDHRIYNPALRFGRSNPHCVLGYLAHPRVSALVADWLQGSATAGQPDLRQ